VFPNRKFLLQNKFKAYQMKNSTLQIGVLCLFMFASLSGQDVKVLEGAPAKGGIIETAIAENLRPHAVNIFSIGPFPVLN
jgi:hypothetical protein